VDDGPGGCALERAVLLFDAALAGAPLCGAAASVEADDATGAAEADASPEDEVVAEVRAAAGVAVGEAPVEADFAAAVCGAMGRGADAGEPWCSAGFAVLEADVGSTGARTCGTTTGVATRLDPTAGGSSSPKRSAQTFSMLDWSDTARMMMSQPSSARHCRIHRIRIERCCFRCTEILQKYAG